MKKLIIYEFQAKDIENTLRETANYINAKEKTTCMDRDVMEALEMIRNILNEQPDKKVKR